MSSRLPAHTRLVLTTVVMIVVIVSLQKCSTLDSTRPPLTWVRDTNNATPRALAFDDELVIEPGAGSFRTVKSFGACSISLEFKVPDMPETATGQHRGNSGVYLLDLYEIQILDTAGAPPAIDGCGAIYNQTAPSVNAAKPAGQWQSYEIDFSPPTFDASNKKIANARVTARLNGVTIHDDVEITSPTGSRHDRPETATGPILLQDHGDGAVRFRNLFIGPRTPPALSKKNQSSHFAPLFNDMSLEGWHQLGGHAAYRAQDHSIVGETRPNQPNSFLVTDRNYADFELDLEFKVDPTLNSGVQFRSESTPEFENGRVHGYQAEIDPSDRAWTAGIYDEGRRGWLASLEANPAAQHAFKQNQWNSMRIVAVGDHLRTFLNGLPVANITDAMTRSGFIGLQVHNVGPRTDPLEVRWRNLRIREIPLPPGKRASSPLLFRRPRRTSTLVAQAPHHPRSSSQTTTRPS